MEERTWVSEIDWIDNMHNMNNNDGDDDNNNNNNNNNNNF